MEIFGAKLRPCLSYYLGKHNEYHFDLIMNIITCIEGNHKNNINRCKCLYCREQIIRQTLNIVVKT